MTEVEMKTPMTLSYEQKQAMADAFTEDRCIFEDITPPINLTAESECRWANGALDRVVTILLNGACTTSGICIKATSKESAFVEGEWDVDGTKPTEPDIQFHKCVYILMNHIFPILKERHVMQRNVRLYGDRYVCVFVKEDDTTAYFMFQQEL
jgi:hypothetical protein